MESLRNVADQARSYADIEAEARLVRELLGFDRYEPLPSIPLFEDLGRLRAANGTLPVTYGVEDLPLGVEAETRFIQENNAIEVVLASDTYDQLEHELPRARFCLTHEVGHVVLHPAELMRLSRLPSPKGGLARGHAGDFPRYLDAEWQANAFASAFLMPASALAKLDLVGKLCVEEIRKNFNVSQTCARFRLEKFLQKRELLLNRR